MKREHLIIAAGIGLLVLFFLLRKREFELGKGLEEGGEIPENYPDYSSWLDRNKIWLDPYFTGSEKIGSTPITTTEPATPSETESETTVTPETEIAVRTEKLRKPELKPEPSGGFDIGGALTDIATWLGIAGAIEGIKRLARRFKPKEPPKGGVPEPTPEEVNIEVRKPIPKPEPAKEPMYVDIPKNVVYEPGYTVSFLPGFTGAAVPHPLEAAVATGLALAGIGKGIGLATRIPRVIKAVELSKAVLKLGKAISAPTVAMAVPAAAKEVKKAETKVQSPEVRKPVVRKSGVSQPEVRKPVIRRSSRVRRSSGGGISVGSHAPSRKVERVGGYAVGLGAARRLL